MFDKPRVMRFDGESHFSENDVIVFLLWHLGDVLNSTALFPELVAKHNRKLLFATTKQCIPILENNPYLEEIIIIDVEIPSRLSSKLWRKLQRLPQVYFPQGVTVYNLHVPVNLDHARFHILECWAKTVGITKSLSELTPEYFSTPNQHYKSKYGNAFVFGNGGSREKRWPIKKWNEVVTIIKAIDTKVPLIQLGHESDTLIEGVEDLRGRTTIDVSYHILKHCKGCLTNDSFLAHLSAVSGCPTFVMFGPTSPTHFRPLGHGEVFTLGAYRVLPRPLSLSKLILWLAPGSAFPSVRAVFASVKKVLGRKNL